MQKWAAVIGSPIDHSLSPVLHQTAYEILGLDWQYRKYQVEVETLPAFFSGLDEQCVGLSVTAPLKRAVLGEVDAADGLAKLVASANTVVFSSAMSAAFNTDVQGIVETLKPTVKGPAASQEEGESVVEGSIVYEKDLHLHREPLAEEDGSAPVVFGTGATACSTMAALRTLGFHRVNLVGRSFAGPDNAFMRGLDVGLDVRAVPISNLASVASVVGAAPVVVSTIPPQVAAGLAPNLRAGEGATLLDVTYAGGASPLAGLFEAAGGFVASPLSMLTHQGIAQVKLMTNRDVPYEPVFDAVLTAAGSSE